MTKLLVASSRRDNVSVEIVNLDPETQNLICENQLFDDPDDATPFNGNKFFNCDCFTCKAYQSWLWESIPIPENCQHITGTAKLTNSEGKEVLLIFGGNSSTGVNFGTYNGSVWNYEQREFQAVLGSCMVKINSSTIFLIGGYETGDTYFYNAKINTWTPGPSLNISRAGSACGIVTWRNPESNNLESIVVTAGGYHKGALSVPSSVELLYLNDDGSSNGGWTWGPQLPTIIKSATMVEYNNTMILIGSVTDLGLADDRLFQLSSPKGPWVTMTQKLTQKRTGFVTFLVNDALAQCHE